MGVMGAQEEKRDRYAEKKLLGWSVLSAIVDLLPHIQVVEGSAVELERYAANVVEHDVRANHVGNVGQRPRRFLGDTRNDIEEDFEASDYDDVDGPCS